MKFRIIYTNNAVKDLNKLGVVVARQIVKKIKFYSTKGSLRAHAKRLKPPFDDLFRLRVGDYRVIFEMDRKGNLIILIILTIKHRKDVYK